MEAKRIFFDPKNWMTDFILFLATWAGGLWVMPFGPVWWGVPWLPFLLVGLFIALLLAALIPGETQRPRPKTPSEIQRQAHADAESIIALDIFFWFSIVGFLVAIIVGYVI
jgi:hypothetical protein